MLPKYKFLNPSDGIPVNTHGETYPDEFIKIDCRGFQNRFFLF